MLCARKEKKLAKNVKLFCIMHNTSYKLEKY